MPYSIIRRGFTLMELMVAVVLLSILTLFLIYIMRNQLDKGVDVKRKADLMQIKTAFEDYYNDKNCYPTQSEWDAATCGGRSFDPYLPIFPCDPRTGAKYLYVPLDACAGYRLYATLDNKADPDIARVGCGAAGCGWGVPANYNYGIAVGTTVAEPGFVVNPTIAPTASPTPGVRQTFPEGYNVCLGDGSHQCNSKSTLVSYPTEFAGRVCADVLREEYGCATFESGQTCAIMCQTQYSTYTCPETEVIVCN